VKGHTGKKPPSPVTRRRMLQALTTIGITGPLALELVAQSRDRISVDTLRRASAVLGEEFSAERLAVIEKALQRNLDQFQMVRDLVIDDLVEPAPIFVAKQPSAPRASATTRSRR
jgi:hypothetical protein